MVWNQAYRGSLFSDFLDGFTRSRLKFNPMKSISEIYAVNWNNMGGMKKKSFTRKRKKRLLKS